MDGLSGGPGDEAWHLGMPTVDTAGHIHWEGLLDNRCLVRQTLLQAVAGMEGIEFDHPHSADGPSPHRTFKVSNIRSQLEKCVEYARHCARDVRDALTAEEIGSIYTWTGTPLPYVVRQQLANADGSDASINRVLPYLHLFTLACSPPGSSSVGRSTRGSGVCGRTSVSACREATP